MKVILLIVISIFFAKVSIASDELMLKVPPLIKNQPMIRSIYRIGDDIIVNTENFDSTTRKTGCSFWKYDEKKNFFIPFIADDAEKVVAVSENCLPEIIATSDGTNLHFKFINQPKRNKSIAMYVEPPFLLSANESFVFVVAEDRVIEVSNKGSRTIHLKGLVHKKWRVLPSAITVTKNELIIGYDRGEWGGAAYSIRIDKNGLVRKSKFLLSANVCAMDQDSDGRIWIASGLSHSTLRKAGLHFYDGKTVTKIITQKNLKNKEVGIESPPPISFPKPTEISGMIVNSKDEVVFVASEIGLFSYTIAKPLNNLWRGNLSISYSMPGYQIGSSPQGIIEKGNKLFVASRSLGVFSFEMLDNGNYIPIKQIVFEKKFIQPNKFHRNN